MLNNDRIITGAILKTTVTPQIFNLKTTMLTFRLDYAGKAKMSEFFENNNY